MLYKIRSLEPDDAGKARKLYLEALNDSFSELPTSALRAYEADWTEELILKNCSIESGYMVGAFDTDNNAVGLLLCTAPEGGVATIIWLLVKPSAQGHGIGRALVDQAKLNFVSHGCHKLKLFAPVERAKKFYEHLGFVTEGIHAQHWWRHTFWSLALFID